MGNEQLIFQRFFIDRKSYFDNCFPSSEGMDWWDLDCLYGLGILKSSLFAAAILFLFLWLFLVMLVSDFNAKLIDTNALIILKIKITNQSSQTIINLSYSNQLLHQQYAQNMFNVYKAELMIKNHERGIKKQNKDKQWIKKYRMQTQPSLIFKHQRRITGFAKKMECQPVELHADSRVIEENRKSETSRMKNTMTSKISFRLPLKTRAFSQTKLQPKTMLSLQKYQKPIATYRDRNKNRQINPPMKYGNVLSKQYLQNVMKENKRKKKQQARNNNTSLISRKQSQSNENHSIDQLVDINHSDFDQFLQQKARQYEKELQIQKAQKQIREQEELKALSHDRLYFKSLIHFRDKTKDTLIQRTLDDVLVKCRVVKKSKERQLRAETEKDLFAQIMRLSVGRNGYE